MTPFRFLARHKLSARVMLGCLSLFALSAFAVGIGDINVHSQLGQPLRMSVPLDQVGDLNAEQLQVGFASQAQYQALGVERPSFHNRMKLTIRDSAKGRTWVDISTERPVNEPFVVLVLEVRWPQGKLYREFTVLLDPPG